MIPPRFLCPNHKHVDVVSLYMSFFHIPDARDIVIDMLSLHIFISTAYKTLAQKSPSNGHVGVSSGARGLICGQKSSSSTSIIGVCEQQRLWLVYICAGRVT